VSDIELAWAAGFWDGEGCAGAYRFGKGQKCLTLALRMAQSGSPETLERFMAAVGGRGRLTGPYTRKPYPNRQPFWNWGTSKREDALAVIALLRPFVCSVKRDQFDRALAAMEASQPRVYRRQSAA
jgi:hypothetical protein